MLVNAMNSPFPHQDAVNCLRFVNTAEWDPSSPEWHRLMLQLPTHEQTQVMRFVFAKDQKLALASRLLQRQLIHELFQVKYNAIEIERTPEVRSHEQYLLRATGLCIADNYHFLQNKPYWKRPAESLAPPSWNYNVSHHGTIVAIASDSQALVGVDVVRLVDRPCRKTSIEEFFRAFADYFNPGEWNYIRGAASVQDEDGQYTRFYRLWSLKEAYIKAVGIGLGFSLLRAEFILRDSVRWELILDGQRAVGWHFACTQLDSMHLVSIAYGPYSAMWMPRTSSLFPSVDAFPIVSTTSIEETERKMEWQQWRLQHLLR